MRSWFHWLLTINSPDEDIRRRGRNILYVILFMFLLIIIGVTIVLSSPPIEPSAILIDITATGIYIALIIAVRRGQVSIPAIMLIVIFILGVSLTFPIYSAAKWSFMLYLLPMLIASLSLRSWQIWLTFIATCIAFAITITMLNAAPQNIPINVESMLFAMVIMAILTAMLFLGTRSLEKSLRQTDILRQNAEHSSKQLADLNNTLEHEVSTRTADLQQTLVEVQEREAYLKHTLSELSASRATIRELSAPIMPILPGVLIAPLIGAFDEERAANVMQNVLLQVRRANTHVLILDVTGMPLIDTHVASILLHISQAVKLLGTRTMLVGVRPEVAQTLVALHVDLASIETFANLQEAVLSLMDQRTISKPASTHLKMESASMRT